MLLERLLHLPGFVYQSGDRFYFLGKWICKECTDVNITECVAMYQMCRASGEEPDTNLYFQKLRAFSDFALEIPYNPSKIHDDMSRIIDGLSESESTTLETQVQCFEEDLQKYAV